MTLDLNEWVPLEVKRIFQRYLAGECITLEVYGALEDLLAHASVDEVMRLLPWWFQYEWRERLDQWRDAKPEGFMIIRADFMGTAHITDEQIDRRRAEFFGKIYPKMDAWFRANEKLLRWPPSMRLMMGRDTLFVPVDMEWYRRRLNPHRGLSKEERKDQALRNQRRRILAALKAMAEIEHEREQAMNL